MEMLSGETLETLVKLAAAGTSGICVLCIVASALVVVKTSDNASPAKIQLIKFFIKVSFAVAVLSAVSALAASSLDYKSRQNLRQQNTQLTSDKTVLANKNTQLTASLDSTKRDLVRSTEISRTALAFFQKQAPTSPVGSTALTLKPAELKTIHEAMTQLNAISAANK